MTNTNKQGVDHEELAPCPFCGGRAELVENTDALAGNGVITIRCCADMEEGFILPEYIKSNSKDSRKKARARVIKAWNTRSDTQELEQLRQELESLQFEFDTVKRIANETVDDLEQERNSLAAYVALLRKALVATHEEAGTDGGVSRLSIEGALDSTPIINLQQHDNEVIDRCASELQNIPFSLMCNEPAIYVDDGMKAICTLKTGQGIPPAETRTIRQQFDEESG